MSDNKISFDINAWASTKCPTVMFRLKKPSRSREDDFQEWWKAKASKCPACLKDNTCNISNEPCQVNKCFYLFVNDIEPL
jgi:hypothetical protein